MQHCGLIMQLVRAAIRAARPSTAAHRRLTTMAAAKRVHFDSTTCPCEEAAG